MIRHAESQDIPQIVSLLLAAHSNSPYRSIPLQRGKITRQVALNVAKGLSWVRVHGDQVKALCLADAVESILGLHSLVVHAVYGGGGFWLLKKVVAQAEQLNAATVGVITSLASDDARVHDMINILGGVRAGSMYEVQIWHS